MHTGSLRLLTLLAVLVLWPGCAGAPEVDAEAATAPAPRPPAAPEEPAPLEPREILTQFGFVGVGGVSERQLANYRRVFGFGDANRDGRHSHQEYVVDGRYMTQRARQGIFAAADRNGDGFVSMEEYVENRIITDEAKRIFDELDADRDRRVTEREFLAGEQLEDEELARRVFQALDSNGDGELVVPEYLRVWGRWARS
ncbi:MAG: EF-hand domain-containing protein [Planctomycetota bacterium]|nr:EF-hand domain-containing protein [Planctomycetota bacterium]